MRELKLKQRNIFKSASGLGGISNFCRHVIDPDDFILLAPEASFAASFWGARLCVFCVLLWEGIGAVGKAMEGQ